MVRPIIGVALILLYGCNDIQDKCEGSIIGKWSGNTNGDTMYIEFTNNGKAIFDYSLAGGKKFVDNFEVSGCLMQTSMYPNGLSISMVKEEQLKFYPKIKVHERDVDLIYSITFSKIK